MTTSPSLIEARPISATPRLMFQRHNDLVDAVIPGGPRDGLTIDAVLELLPSLPNWPPQGRHRYAAKVQAFARMILEWLTGHPGSGWQERWMSSGADNGVEWLDTLAALNNPRGLRTVRADLVQALSRLLLCRIVFPSYPFLASYRAFNLYSHVRQVFRPDLFAVVEERANSLAGGKIQSSEALAAISKIVLHTGRDVDQLTADDLLRYRAFLYRGGRNDDAPGVHLAWSALHGIADIGEHSTLREALRLGQRPTHELVDAHGIQSRNVREVLIKYLDERRPALDYTSFQNLIGNLVGLFWSDIELHHPGLDTLNLPDEVAESWKERLHVVSTNDGGTRPRKNRLAVLICVRGFYRDLQEWSLQDPAWVQWSFPNPIRMRETVGQAKAKRRTTARIHQRVREQLSHLPALVDAAERGRAEQAGLLATTNATAVGAQFEHAGRQYRRIAPRASGKEEGHYQMPANKIEDVATGKVFDVGRPEHEAFWSWAVIETLRHTGVRIEELLEMTHRARLV